MMLLSPARRLAALRWGSILATTGIAAGATLLFARFLSTDGWQSLDVLLLAIFVVLNLWTSSSCVISVLGIVVLLHRRFRRASVPTQISHAASRKPSLTALVIPVFNEDPARVFDRIDVMRRDLALDPASEHRFEFVVLSDSSEREICNTEWESWRARQGEHPDRPALFYRRRQGNSGRKAGNIAEFCRRWGGRYDYMVVLDADSLM